MPRYLRETLVPASAEALYGWHARPGAFERLIPPWVAVRLLSAPEALREGALVTLSVPMGPLRRRWVARICDLCPGREFTDEQVSGPFKRWRHRHRFEVVDGETSRLVDEIDYELPLGFLGKLGAGFVRRELDRLFAWRHALTVADLADAKMSAGSVDMSTEKILITGASGLVGSALVPYLDTQGYEVLAAQRAKSAAPTTGARWSIEEGLLPGAHTEGLHAVVHLAGENIASRRWSSEQMRRIRESRVLGTRMLAQSLAAMENPPKVLVCASAIGFYGDRGQDVVTEESEAGEGFLADVVRAWEEAAAPAEEAGIRVVHLRFGVILDTGGGALAKMLRPFRLGLGGRVGSGKQLMSWITREDAVRAIHHAITEEGLGGPINAVAPSPTSNREYTRTLGRVLRRPTIFPLPAPVARLMLGKMADALLLASTGVVPRRLEDSGFQWRHPDLQGALRALLGRT